MLEKSNETVCSLYLMISLLYLIFPPKNNQFKKYLTATYWDGDDIVLEQFQVFLETDAYTKGESNNEGPWLNWVWKWIFIMEMVKKISALSCHDWIQSWDWKLSPMIYISHESW